MSKHTTRPEPSHSRDVSTDRPGPLKRLASTVVWYSPELTGVAVSAGAAATVWAPLGALGVALGAWIATDQVNIARERRHARRALTRSRRERAQLDAAEHDDTASTDTGDEHADDDPMSDDVSADVSGTDTTSGAPAAEGRSGWEVAG